MAGLTMKKKTTWAAAVVKKQLQTCCKHQTFSMETTERDDCTSHGFNSPSREVHISSPMREAPGPVLQRHKSFGVMRGRSLLTTPEPLTPFRKSVESAIPLCRSSTFKSPRLQNVKSPHEIAAAAAAAKGKVVLDKTGPLPVLLSGPLLGGRAPPPKLSGAPSPQPRISMVTIGERHGDQCGSLNIKDENGGDSAGRAIAAAVNIQAVYRGHQARRKFALMRGSSNPKELEEEEEPAGALVEEAPSISTRVSRTDPHKQRRIPPPRANKGWNGSIRSAQDHQALLRSRQEAALKRERAMEYALSRQRWRTRGFSKGWITDDRVPDKPGWVRSWLERATRMSNQNSQSRVFNDEFEPAVNPPESENLSMKSTVGMCTTDIGSLEANPGWSHSPRQHHPRRSLQSTIPTPPPRRRSAADAKIKCRKIHSLSNEFPTSCGVVTSEDSICPVVDEQIYCRDHSDDRESVGSCEGPVLSKLPSPIVVATKQRLQQLRAKSRNSTR